MINFDQMVHATARCAGEKHMLFRQTITVYHRGPLLSTIVASER